ncbi:hypothetical protein DRQ33_08450, partial [bacterium]
FIQLTKLFRENGFSVMLIGEGDNKPGIRWSDKISLETLVGLISFSRIFVGNDSGPAHIAGALGIPTVSIFGPTHPALGFTPRGRYVTYVSAELECSPCTIHGKGKCKFKTRKCFDMITPEQVFEKAIKIYEKSKQ